MKSRILSPLLLSVVFASKIFCEAATDSVKPSSLSAANITNTANSDPSNGAKRALKILAKVERAVNEWGAFSVSDLLLVPQKGQFDLSLTNIPTTTYIEKARDSQSGSAALTDFGRFAGKFEGTVDTLPGINAGKPAEAGPSFAPVSNTVTVTNFIQTNGTILTLTNSTTTYGPVPAGQAFNADQFGAAPTTLNAAVNRPGASRISERQVLEQGISDKIYEQLLSVITRPTDLLTNQVVVFGIVQVSCQPGWRTSHDYIADLQIQVRYAKHPKTESASIHFSDTKSVQPPRPQADPEGWQTSDVSSPSIYAVLPLTDSLQFDLNSRRRRELDLAAAVAGTFVAQGLNGEAKKLTKFIRERDFSLESASMLPVASTYTDGGSFGFRIYPRPQGITKPGDPYSGPGNVLQPVSFPALVGIIVDRQEVESDCSWTHFRVDTHTRWIPVQGQAGPFMKAIQKIYPNYRGGNWRDQLNLAELGNLAGRLQEAEAALKTCPAQTNDNPLVLLAGRALTAHRGNIFGYTRFARLPLCSESNVAINEVKQVTIRSIAPSRILNTNQPVVFTLKLENLNNNSTGERPRVWIGGIEATHIGYDRQQDAAIIIASASLPEAHGPVSIGVVVQIDGHLVVGEFGLNFPTAATNGGNFPKTPTPLKLSTGAKLKLDGEIPVQIEPRPQ
jgi:hypothetical protein